MTLTRDAKQHLKARILAYTTQYNRIHAPLVAVFCRFPDGSYRDVLVAVSRVTPAAIEAEVRRYHPNAKVHAWREVGTLTKGIEPELCAAFGLNDAEKLY